MTYSRDEIITFLRNGQNQKAIEFLYSYYPSVLNYIKKNGGNEADAKDMFQDALVILYRNAQNPEFSLSCSPLTYLYGVVKFLWKDALKKKNREINTDDPSALISSEVDFMFEESSTKKLKLNKILSLIGEKCKAILKAYYYDRLSMNEIAENFDFTSVNSAKTQKYKCIEKAKKLAVETETSPVYEL